MAWIRVAAARFGLFVFALVTLSIVGVPVAAARAQTEYDRVYATAYAQLGDQWKFQAKGPDVFDCTGLVWYSFKQNDLQDRIGGKYRTVRGFYRWFKNHGKVSRRHPHLGDLIVWGDNQHLGIYIGDGMAISTLTTKSGVSIHPVKGYLGIRFKAYLHVKLTRP